MLQRFLKFIIEKNLFEKDTPVIAAVSGGIDSITLCTLLKKGGFNFAIAHCNFQLRGEESEQDYLFVKAFAQQNDIPFFSKRFETKKFAHSEKISIQMAARDLRYQWFDELLASGVYERTVTAHHKSDLAETILLNLVRGTGLAGLHGIKAKNGSLVRPLLFAEREDIANYAKENTLTWREDSSNLSTKYQRNYIRHKVIPLLKQLNPSFEETLNATAQKIKSAENMLEAHINKIIEKVFDKKKGEIDLVALKKEQEPDFIIYKLLKPFGFNFSQCSKIMQAIESGKHFESASHSLFFNRGNLILKEKKPVILEPVEIQEGTTAISMGTISLSIKTIEAKVYTIKKEKAIGAFDYEKLSFPLELKVWEKGDRFHPLGMKQSKKVSDFLIDRKMPLPEKEMQLILKNKSDIIWVVGQRIDERFKVNTATKKVWEITVKSTDN